MVNVSPNLINKERLREVVRSIEALEVEKSDIANEQKLILEQSKTAGLDPKVIKEVIKRRKINQKELENWDHAVQVYEESVDA